jgi:cyclophilin family peptidyl-prolyl cis-trans isomerase
MKSSSKNRRSRGAPSFSLQPLEARCLLSATVLQQIPTESATVGQTPTSITLSTYLNDPSITGGTVVEMETPLGNMYLQLTDSVTPLTVANFVQYISNGEYTPTIIQRSAPGFVLQGGGTKPDGSDNTPLADVPSEAGQSNVTGTIAMALSSGPDTGNNQWFINLGDNSSILDGSNDGGPFTVFGNVIDGGMTVANAISNLQIIDGSAENPNWYIGPDDGLPVINYSGSDTPTSVPQDNLVTDNTVVVPSGQAKPTYSAMSANPSLVTASVVNGQLVLTPVAGAVSGSTTVTATVTDVAGETASSTFTVNVTGLPAAPTGVAATTDLAHHVGISWSPISGATSYQVFRSTTDDFSTATRIAALLTSPSYNDTTAVAGTVYFYWVRGKDSVGVGANTGTSGYMPFPAPTNVTPTDLTHHVSLTWSAVTNALSYQVFRSTTDDFSTATRIQAGIATTFFNDTTAASGQTYFYWVRAKGASVVGLQSVAVMGGLS